MSSALDIALLETLVAFATVGAIHNCFFLSSCHFWFARLSPLEGPSQGADVSLLAFARSIPPQYCPFGDVYITVGAIHERYLSPFLEEEGEEVPFQKRPQKGHDLEHV